MVSTWVDRAAIADGKVYDAHDVGPVPIGGIA